MGQLDLRDFIDAKLQERGLRRADVVRRMGYENISSGLNSLRKFESGEFDHAFIRPRIAAALGVEQEKLDGEIRTIRQRLRKAEEEANERRIEWERVTFVPTLLTATVEKIPRPIVIYSFVGPYGIGRLTRMPATFSSWDWERRLDHVRSVIRNLVRRWNGSIPLFGKITHFVLKIAYDDPEERHLVFDLDGELIADPSPDQRQLLEGETTLVLRGKRVHTPLLEDGRTPL